MLDWYLDCGWVLIDNNLVLTSLIKRNFVEKNDFLQVGLSKMKIPQNFVNLNKFANNEYSFKENSWSLSDLKSDNSVEFEFIEQLHVIFDKFFKKEF